MNDDCGLGLTHVAARRHAAAARGAPSTGAFSAHSCGRLKLRTSRIGQLFWGVGRRRPPPPAAPACACALRPIVHLRACLTWPHTSERGRSSRGVGSGKQKAEAAPRALLSYLVLSFFLFSVFCFLLLLRSFARGREGERDGGWA